MTDVNEDKGYNEIFTDGGHHRQWWWGWSWEGQEEGVSCQGQEKEGLPFVLISSEVGAREGLHWEPAEFLDPFWTSAKAVSSSPPLPSPVLVQAHHSCARTSVLFPGAHFPHRQRKLPKKHMWPHYLVSCSKPFLVKTRKHINCPLFLACILCSNNTRLLLVTGPDQSMLLWSYMLSSCHSLTVKMPFHISLILQLTASVPSLPTCFSSSQVKAWSVRATILPWAHLLYGI